MAKNKQKRWFFKNPLEVIVELTILIILIPFFYNLSLFAFFCYIFAFFSIVVSGALFWKKKIARSIVIGSFLTYFASLIVFYGIKQSDLLLLSISIIFGLWVWYKGYKIKKFRI